MNIEQHVSSTAMILPLDAAHATLELVGGKGASLARMAGAGLPVPAGFHITTAAYRRFVEQNSLQEKFWPQSPTSALVSLRRLQQRQAR